MRSQPRKIPRQSRSRATLDAIVVAAARVLEKDGYDRMNVNRVAAVAGVSVGSLYQYFPTKEALAAAVAKQLSKRMMDEFGRDLGDLAVLEPKLAVARIVERAVVVSRIAPRLRRVIREQVPAATTAFQTHDFDAELIEVFVAYLELHRASVRPRDLRLAARLLMRAVEGIADGWAGDPGVDGDELVAETAELVRRYLLRDVIA